MPELIVVFLLCWFGLVRFGSVLLPFFSLFLISFLCFIFHFFSQHRTENQGMHLKTKTPSDRHQPLALPSLTTQTTPSEEIVAAVQTKQGFFHCRYLNNLIHRHILIYIETPKSGVVNKPAFSNRSPWSSSRYPPYTPRTRPKQRSAPSGLYRGLTLPRTPNACNSECPLITSGGGGGMHPYL